MAQAVKVAVAAFVKTPGFSAVKTRLAAEIGQERAEEFYGLAWRAVSTCLRTSARTEGVTPIWAVAEALAAAHAAWPEFLVVSQGEGSLSERLTKVYRELFAAHDAVIFVGADCPQLSPADVAAATAALRGGAPFAVGPAADGGFYLFAGKSAVPPGLFERVPMSAPDTGQRLVTELRRIGPVAILPQRTDVDLAQDLAACARELAALAEPSPEQLRLAAWIARAVPA